jgi:hypothetical protein
VLDTRCYDETGWNDCSNDPVAADSQERTQRGSGNERAGHDVRLPDFTVGEQLACRSSARIEQPPQRGTERLAFLMPDEQIRNSRKG